MAVIERSGTSLPTQTSEGRPLATISVVIPTYNGARWIVEGLESVLTQTCPPDEVIVVDDASTDETVARVAGVASRSTVPVRMVRRETNSGLPAVAVNIGVAQARGAFVAVLDQDDVFLPSKLERQARALRADSGTAFVFSLYGVLGADGSRRDKAEAWRRVRRIQRRITGSDGCLRYDGSVVLRELGRVGNLVGGFPGFMFRRSAWERRGGLDEGLLIASDYDFLCWLCTQGSVGLIPTIHYRRREHEGNLMQRTGIQWRLDLVTVMLRHASSSGARDVTRVMQRSIRHHLSQLARRLGSAGHWRHAREVCLAAIEIGGGGWTGPFQRWSIPAYRGYRSLIRRPWTISAEQASQAVGLAKRAARALSGSGGAIA